MTTTLHYDVHQNVAEIMMDGPPVNAISETMMDRLIGLFRKAGQDRGVKALILGSQVPGRFCAGLHLSEMAHKSFEQKHALVEKLYTGLLDAQMQLGKPSIAAINGTARGGGMTLAISCDVLLASQNATFGYPEIDVGVTPAIHYTHLPRIIGKHRAFELLFTGRSFDAQEALRLGLVNALHEEAQLLEQARAMAQVFCRKSPLVMQMGRKAFHNAVDVEFRRGVNSAVEHFANVAGTDDAIEGMRAFAEKRAPQWPSAR